MPLEMTICLRARKMRVPGSCRNTTRQFRGGPEIFTDTTHVAHWLGRPATAVSKTVPEVGQLEETYTVWTATALPFSRITLSTLVLHARYRFEWTARVAWT